MNNKRYIIQLFLLGSIVPSLQSSDGALVVKKTLHEACASNDRDRIAELLQGSAEEVKDLLKQDDAKGRTPLYYAFTGNYVDTVEDFLRLGAQPNQYTAGNVKPCHVVNPFQSACLNGNRRMVEAFVRAGASIEHRSYYEGLTAFWLAVKTDHLEIVEYLLLVYQPEIGEEFDTLVPKADRKDNPSAQLVEEYQNGKYRPSFQLPLLNLTSEDTSNAHIKGKTALHVACEKGELDLVEMYVKAGVDLKQRDQSGYTAMHHAVMKDRAGVVEYLLKNGDDPQGPKLMHDGQGIASTPLHLAVLFGRDEVARALVKAGADPRMKNAHGRTPLKEAVLRGRPEAVKYLLSLKPDITEDEFTNGDLVMRKGNSEFCRGVDKCLTLIEEYLGRKFPVVDSKALVLEVIMQGRKEDAAAAQGGNKGKEITR